MAPKEKKGSDAVEHQVGSIFSVSGPVIVAENMVGCAMYELVRQLIQLISDGICADESVSSWSIAASW